MTFSKNPFCAFFFVALLFLTLTFVLKKWHFGLPGTFGDAARPDGLTPERDRLHQQLEERQQELELLYITSDNAQSSEGFIDPHLAINESVRSENPEMDIGCEELHAMKAVDSLGSGYTKTVLKAVSPQGSFVALKSVNHQGTDMRLCMEDFKDHHSCHELVSFKLRKEIVLLQGLQHPNIVQLKGQCQDSAVVGGVTAVLEQGMPLQMIQLLQSPWEERFRNTKEDILKNVGNRTTAVPIHFYCMDTKPMQDNGYRCGSITNILKMIFFCVLQKKASHTVRLLHYLSYSPLGSVALLDFQPRQFITVSGELKLTDLDDASIEEPGCVEDSDCLLQFPLRNFTLRCSPSRICEGLNEMRNLYNAYRYFFTYLLPHQAPPLLKSLLEKIMNSTGDLKQSINETLVDFEEVLRMYKSGLHLENLPPLISRDYAVLKGMRSVGNMEYRCWPSYNQQGCVLSVHSTREASLICNSHPQCTSFSLSKERTWTGRLLASFRSGFSHLVPDVNSAVYMRKVKASGAVL